MSSRPKKIKTSSYYCGKETILKDIFGANQVVVDLECLVVDNKRFPIIEDVIVLLDPSEYPSSITITQESQSFYTPAKPQNFAKDIQFTFGKEWKHFPEILPEHHAEFQDYFDLIDTAGFKNSRVCDLGCGIGRWSYFLAPKCKEMIVVDFSEAIFVARENLKSATNTIFFMANLQNLPFRDDFADFVYCLGVLHHLPTNALDEIRSLKRFSPQLLIYLYYSLDNRPSYFKFLLSGISLIRKNVSRIKNSPFRIAFTWTIAMTVYVPLILAGRLLGTIHSSNYIPLHEAYKGKSLKRIRQDVYDRFFTRIEQRYSQKEILKLKDTFPRITISEKIPFWHFLCER